MIEIKGKIEILVIDWCGIHVEEYRQCMTQVLRRSGTWRASIGQELGRRFGESELDPWRHEFRAQNHLEFG